MIPKAIHIAKRSPNKFQVGCVLLKGDKLVSVGWNHKASGALRSVRSIHAEMHAIFRGNKRDIEGSVCYVARLSRKSGNVGLAKPCDECSRLLSSFGVSSVIYTVNADITGVIIL